jgi:spermidine synthase
LYIAIVWGARDLANLWRVPRVALALGASAVLLVCGFLTSRQVGVWKGSLSLFRHAERVTAPNIVTLNNLITELLAHRQIAEADARIDTAIRLFPNEHLTWWHAANRAQRRGMPDEAVAHYQTALHLRPSDPQLNFLLALALQQQNKPEAIHYYREAIRLDPQSATALNNLAWLLATHPDAILRNVPEAVQFAERACQLAQWQHPYFLGTLAAAYAAAGKFSHAVAAAEKAITIAEARSDKQHAERTRTALSLYRKGQPWSPSDK